jgi:uncharacterized tellurite resistance protein B-like protein
MATIDWRRLQGPAIGFALALVPLIWALRAVMGRSLSPVELPFILVGLAAIVIAFTWALAPEKGSGEGSESKRQSEQSHEIAEFFAKSADQAPPGIGQDRSASGVGLSSDNAPDRQPTTCAGMVSAPRVVTKQPGSTPNANRGQDFLQWRGAIEELLVSVRGQTISPVSVDTVQADRVTSSLSRAEAFGKEVKNGSPRSRITGGIATPAPLSARAAMRWYGRQETLHAGGFLVDVPMVYASDGPADVEEPSCINLRLELDSQSRTDASGDTELQSYSLMRPNQRSSYLNWLANGRPPRSCSVADRILFLCGLERRLLTEKRDTEPIVNEVVRLLRVCEEQDPAAWCLTRFATFALALPENDCVQDQVVRRLFESSCIDLREEVLAVALARYLNKRSPLPAYWAAKLALFFHADLERTLSAVDLVRVHSLFHTRYVEQVGFGIDLRAFPEVRAIEYHPVNSSIRLAADLLRGTIRSVDLDEELRQGGFLANLLHRCLDGLTPQRTAACGESNRGEPPISPEPGVLEDTGWIPTNVVVHPAPADTERSADVKDSTVHRAQPHEPSALSRVPTLAQLTWYGAQENLQVGNYAVQGPLVYASEGLADILEPSCIDLTLQLGKADRAQQVGMSKLASYAGLHPDQRSAYLDWLANASVAPTTDVAFSLLFLCGVERRLLLENRDQIAIVNRLVRLLSACPPTDLMAWKLARAATFALSLPKTEFVSDDVVARLLECSPLELRRDVLAVALARFFRRNARLPAHWAMKLAAWCDEKLDDSSATLQRPQLQSLFNTRYHEAFGAGVSLRADRGVRETDYYPTNPTIRPDGGLFRFEFVPVDPADALGQGSQLARLLRQCCEDCPPASKATTRVQTTASPNAPASPGAQPGARRTLGPHTAFVVAPSAKGSPGFGSSARPTPDPGSRTAVPTHKQRWIGTGESITVGAFTLRDPLIYVSEGASRQCDPSCIDLSLEVGRTDCGNGGSLGYYPNYSYLKPDQRATYLAWLSTGRIAPLHEMGYALLFFYGLERRVLVDNEDVTVVAREVVRLLGAYPTSVSLDGYLSRFLAFVLARAKTDALSVGWFESEFEKSRLDQIEAFRAVALAWFHRKGVPLPASWAFRVARMDLRSPMSTVVDRVPDCFRALFEIRYREEFQDGIVLAASARQRSLCYRSASASICHNGDRSGPLVESAALPDVLGNQDQFAPLAAIWTRCINELRPLSRALSKGFQLDSREAFETLPTELKETLDHPDKDRWDSLVASVNTEDGCALVEISTLARLHELEERAKLTLKQSEALAHTAQFVGLIVEPDARITKRPYCWLDMVCLIRPEDRSALTTDTRYRAAALMLELGIFIAAADGVVEDTEVNQIATFVESQFLLDRANSRRLEAFKRVCVARPPTLSGLGKVLQTQLTHEQRQAVGKFLTEIAAANGIIDRKELTALRSAYRALDIGVDELNSFVAEFRRRTLDPVEIQKGEERLDSGETIPARPEPGAGIVFDARRLERIMRETQEVWVTLGNVMQCEDEEVPQPLPSVASEREYDPRFATLNPRFHRVMSSLLDRPKWRRAEFDALARSHNLMPAGALDSINDWAYSLFDDPIIVDYGDELEIDSRLMERPS